MGIQFYIGATGQGKTSLAQAQAAELSAERGVPVVILDPEGLLHYDGAEKFRDVPPGDPFIDAVWERGEHVIYTPRNKKDADLFFSRVRAGGDVILIIDECSHYARAPGTSKDLLRLCRAHRMQGVDLYFTTQNPTDLHPSIWNLKHEVYVFHCDSDGAVERLVKELKLPPEYVARIEALPPGRAIKWTRKVNDDAKEKTEIPEERRDDPPDPGVRLGDAAPAP
jgi:hypothetical protein